MNRIDFSYDLPQELIAQTPASPRDSARLLVLDRKTGAMQHRHFYDVLEYLNPGDCLVLNDSKVLPARLYGVKEGTGAHVEFLLLTARGNDVWEVLTGPGSAQTRQRVYLGDGLFEGGGAGDYRRRQPSGQIYIYRRFLHDSRSDRRDAASALHYGHLDDKSQYQTVYVRERGSRLRRLPGCTSRRNCWKRFGKRV